MAGFLQETRKMHSGHCGSEESGKTMTLFAGIHEVRLLRANSVAVGYFDSWDAALLAVENEPTQYKAAYFSLNPVKLPIEIPVNPASLSAARNAASKSDIARRVCLLVDLDPPRPAGLNSTEAEKQSARVQAEAVREYLGGRGWPEPMLCDSGNGWHALYRIELANDEDSAELVRGVLARLHQLFPLVDAGNFDSNRLCKLYGSWARKGPHSDERPWRKSSIVEGGSDAIVSETQLRELAPAQRPALAVENGNVKLERLLGFLDHYGVALRSDAREVSGGWQVEIECPWAEEHTSEARRDTTVSFIAGLGNGFRCLHSHCTERHWREFRAELERRNPGLDPYFGKLPLMTHSDIARQFIEDHDDFVRVYDQENATGVWLPGVRWQLGDAGDALLRVSIRRYLDYLYSRYPRPEQGKRDYRLTLKQAAFVSGVLSEIKPWLPPKDSRDFDTDPTILPLPNGKVADLWRGSLREMVREDCQTKRIGITPENVQTPRWDRFLREISCGDAELAAYIVRLMALCITGKALHLLIIFFGVGRNGKGITLRLLEKILGREMFAVSLRPEDVEYRRGSEDRNKRLMGRLRGKRLAYTGETVTGNLDWTLLKMLTGGDTLAGADLYKNTEGFAPSHTLILTTNDRPKLPPTVAFKERLRFVPFNGDFSKSKDFTLEDDLAREMQGILWQLIKAAPAVFANGDVPPNAVLDATADLMQENDLSAPFIQECLVEDSEAVTTLTDMETAIKAWLGGMVIGCDERADRIMKGIRARWVYGRKRVAGYREPVRGLLGVRIVAPS
jgi:P4 family phage/plasmid primase-like protien